MSQDKSFLSLDVLLSGLSPCCVSKDLVPDLVEDLLSAVDQPLKVAHDKGAKRDYLLCDYNRDGNSYRSPWSNKYDPPLKDGAVPSAKLRDIEVEGNNVFDVYRELYYEGGVSSMYAWDLDAGFAAVVLFKKTADASRKGAPMKVRRKRKAKRREEEEERGAGGGGDEEAKSSVR